MPPRRPGSRDHEYKAGCKELFDRGLEGRTDFRQELIDFERLKQNRRESLAAGTHDGVVGIVTEPRRKDDGSGRIGMFGGGEDHMTAVSR